MEKLCLRCGTKFSGKIDLLSGDFTATGLDQCQKTFIRIYYKNCLCPECIGHIRDTFYAFDVSPVYRKDR